MHVRVDLYEADGEFIIEADVPGLRARDLVIDIGADSVLIRGHRRSTRTLAECEGAATTHRSERIQGRFEREIPLPLPVLRDTAEATLRSGLLTIKLVIRKANPPPRRLPVQPPRRVRRPRLDCLSGGEKETAFGN